MAADYSPLSYSPLLEAIQFGTIASGAIGAGAALVGVYLAIKGVRLIIEFIAERKEQSWANPDYEPGFAQKWTEENNLEWDDDKGDFVERR